MTDAYTKTAKTIHWTSAAAIGFLVVIGVTMANLDLSVLKLRLYSWHKWIGLCVLLLTGFRLLWRAGHPPPPPDPALHAHMVLAAKAGHAVLYLLLIALPFAGWAFSSASGIPVVFFGVLGLPDLAPQSKELAEILRLVHKGGAILLIVLVAGHAGAALWHHFRLKDNSLVAMLPARGWLLAVPFGAALMLGAFVFEAPGDGGAATGNATAQIQSASQKPVSGRLWHVDTAKSRIIFVARQMNVPLEGQFTHFDVSVRFDPVAPENASLTAVIDLASASTGQAQVDQSLPGPDWFDVKKYPEATFKSSRFRRTGKDTYAIDGVLSLKGVSRSITLDAKIIITPENDGRKGQKAQVTAATTLKRLAFNIGEGQWKSTATIADEVSVKIKIHATLQN